MTTVAELLIESLADYGVTRSGESWATPSTRSPTRSAARTGSTGSAYATRRPPPSPPAPRPSSPAGSLSAWAPSARVRSTCSTACTTPRSRTPRCWRSAARCPREEIGSDFFQEVDNDALFADVAVFNRTVTEPDQLPGADRAGRQRRAASSAASRC